ncbi:MAG: ATP-binding cassette domain-containing protein [Gemmatimonas sp.]|nr:ATP-binding cassette domain-containing protein [Gemmatimonas sp.]
MSERDPIDDWQPGPLWIIGRTLEYLKPYRRLALVSAVLLVLAAAFSLLVPWPLKILVDHVLQDAPMPPFLASLFGGLALDRSALLIVTVLAGVVIAAIDNGIGVVSKYVNTKIEQHMVLDVRSDLFQNTQRMTAAFHDRKRTGKVIFAINNQGTAAAGLVMAAQPIAQSLLTLVGMFWIVFSIERTLAVLSLTVVPLLYYSIGYYSKRVLPRLRKVRGLEIDSLSIVHEAISMLRVIVAFGREDHEYRRFRSQGQTAVEERVKVTVGETLFSMAVNMSTAVGTGLILWFGAYRSLQGQITVGELLVIMSYIAAVYQPLQTISLTLSSLQQKFVSLESVLGLIDKEPEIRDAPDAVDTRRVRGDVSVMGVSFDYSGRKDTLKEMSFEACAGQLIGIVGPTGAGKTTLVSLIPRFYEPGKGQILVDGIDVQKLTLRSLREQISLVPQEPLLFSGTIADNIRYGRLDAGVDEMVRAAQDANVHDFIMRLPKQYETELGERGAQLSGGERQSVCIARAFLKDAPILILDEPTSAVDSKTEAVILEALQRLMIGRTTFMIAHRLSTLRNADLILVIDRGALIEKGMHEELLLRDGLYKQLYEVQTRQAKGKPQPVIEREEPSPEQTVA